MVQEAVLFAVEVVNSVETFPVQSDPPIDDVYLNIWQLNEVFADALDSRPQKLHVSPLFNVTGADSGADSQKIAAPPDVLVSCMLFPLAVVFVTAVVADAP